MTAYFRTSDDPLFSRLAKDLLHWHRRAKRERKHEDNIKIAVRDFLVRTELTEPYDIEAEGRPHRLSRQRVDLVLNDAFIEVKTSISSAKADGDPHKDSVEQLDGYIAQSPHMSLGILTDGRYWLLRIYGMSKIKTKPPWMFELRSPSDGIGLYRWLHDHVFTGDHDKPVQLETIGEELGLDSYTFAMHYAQLARLYRWHCESETAKVKRSLWELLLTVALGEVTRELYDDTPSVNRHGLTGLEDLFVRHTYLSAVIGMITQASYGIDIAALAAGNPSDLLTGREFIEKTSIAGIIESDFFSWVAEIPRGDELIGELASRISMYDWQDVEPGLASALYQSIIPAEERAALGEYYTPVWLAEAMVDEVVSDPLSQRVLDPACGSGQFLAAAIAKVLNAAAAAGLSDAETLEKLQDNVLGIDLHPVAVHLARSEWVLAARGVISSAASSTRVTPPVYLGDSLQLMTVQEGLFGKSRVVVKTIGDPLRRELEFPRSLVEQSSRFDYIIDKITSAIHDNEDVGPVLAACELDSEELEILAATAKRLVSLHQEGRDHIWSYFSRNVVRPLAIAEQKVDIVIGNPPWINYNQTSLLLRQRLRELSQDYGTWDGGRYATHADLAGLFFTHSMKLYLNRGGECAMVMPHSALAAGHYAKWRSGKWDSPDDASVVDLSERTAWDLETLSPNDFFPVPACVVFGRRVDGAEAEALRPDVVRWSGSPGAEDMARTLERVQRSSVFASRYSDTARQGASIVPRCLFFVEVTPPTTIIWPASTLVLSPRRGRQDKEPWKSLDLQGLEERTIEDRFVFKVVLGATIAPYMLLSPRQALLPIVDGAVPRDQDAYGGAEIGHDSWRFRRRWRTASELWEANKAFHDTKSLCQQVDYYKKLSSQLAWKADPDRKSATRVVYSSSGRPTAAIVDDEDLIVDYTLYWMPCETRDEARFLCGIINSSVLEELVAPYMPKGQFGARHLQKHLWKLPIPAFDPSDSSHQRIAAAAEAAAAGSAAAIAAEAAAAEAHGLTSLSVGVARKWARAWLKSSAEGAEVEAAVGALFR